MVDAHTKPDTPRSNRARGIWASLWPGRAIGLRAIVTTFALWVLLHVFLFIASGEIVALGSFKGLLVLAGVAGAIGLIDLRRRGESILLQNLGVPPVVVPAIWVIAIVALEILLDVVR